MSAHLAELRPAIEAAYVARTPASGALFQRARACHPGGDTRAGAVFAPHPTFFARGEGSTLYDVDGHAVMDWTFNATSLIHGHAHPAIVETVARQAGAGTAWAGPSVPQVRLAEILQQRIPSFERLRFCNSGTEANMMAVRAARAWTGRPLLVKMAGSYHGSYEGTEFDAGDGRPAPTTGGIPENVADNVRVASFGDTGSLQAIMEADGRRVAAILLNPVVTRGRLGIAGAAYFRAAQEIAHHYGALLIFDEVISLRLAYGGAQGRFGVVPDLTAAGKIVGGGLPVGVFGGSAQVMSVFESPIARSRERGVGGESPIAHAGTFNANPLTMAAGIAAMEMLPAAAFERLERYGQTLLDAVAGAVADTDAPFVVAGIGSLVSLTPAPGLAPDVAGELSRLFHLAMLLEDIKVGPLLCVSTVTEETDIRRLRSALSNVLPQFAPAGRRATGG